MIEITFEELAHSYQILLDATVKNVTAWNEYYRAKPPDKKKKLLIAKSYQKKIEDLVKPQNDQSNLFKEFLAK